MTATGYSRRGFLTRAAATAVGLIGGSALGGFSTRAWAHPLLNLGRLPHIDQPKSVVYVGMQEALRREHRASQLSEFQSIVRELTSSGYKRLGEPKGGDGVAGYASAGGHSVVLGFAKKGSDKATVFVEARWWDQLREQWPCDDRMPDVFSKELIRGAAGTPSAVRFRYVDDQRDLVSREFDLDSARTLICEPDCHPHPPGYCPGCTACGHCVGPTNVCTGPDPDCPDVYCVACLACGPVWPCAAACALICGTLCSDVPSTWCCDYVDLTCCVSPVPPFANCV